MRTKTFIIALVSFFTLSAFQIAVGDYPTLKIGDKAPETSYKMKDISGQMYSLNDVKKSNGLLVIFSCNTCPFVMGWEDRYNELSEVATKNNIGLILVNSNEAKRDKDDSFAAMQKHAKDKGYKNLLYVVDENSKLANAFGAKTTPHVFLFNKDMSLAYSGAIDDNYKDAASASELYLKKALVSLGNGKPVNPKETKALGCSIKRAS